jgi:NIPSNAP
MRQSILSHVPAWLAAVAAVILLAQVGRPQPTSDSSKPRVFEIRTYTTEPGKLDALHARFRDHTTKLFEKHGMTNIGYWTPADAPRSQDTLIYVLAHSSREAANKSWDGFRNDPEWIKARDASEASGKIVSKVESIYADPTDFSALK